MLLLAAAGPLIAADNLTSAAQDPHLLADYIGSHAAVDFAALRTTLGVINATISLPPCDAGPCHAEVLDVPGSKPAQAILWASHTSPGGAFWLRFRQTPTGSWRFAGASAVRADLITPEYRLVTAFGKPFFVIVESPINKVGVYNKIESWFDLSLTSTQPAFAYTSEGLHQGGPLGLVHMVKSSALASMRGTQEEFRVEYTAHFQQDSADSTRSPLELGRIAATGYFVRQKSGEFRLAPSLSSAPASVLDSVFAIANQDDGMKNEEFLKADIVGLRRIAAAPRSTAGMWLADFLKHCKDTPEKTELMGLLK